MFPGVNPRQVQQMMKKMGIQQQEIPATEVIIKTKDKEIVIANPSVSKVNMMGQETYQIVGEAEERELSPVGSNSNPNSEKVGISEEDIQTIVEQTGVDAETARTALEEHNGDLAETIIALKKDEEDEE